MKVKTETSPEYTVTSLPSHADVQALRTVEEDKLIAEALDIVRRRLVAPGAAMNSPQDVKNYALLAYSTLPHEEFGVLLLDAQHRVVFDGSLFRGTLTQTSVYPREVVKLALAKNAAAVIFVHNHPSGHPEPSRADEYLTTTLKSALATVDVRVLDHLVVGGIETVSFAERGLL